ncbi:MAG TPA: DUF3603 family protein [Bacillota bacterium]|nr:DUF3603 family protein [Bacillota bacterium]
MLYIQDVWLNWFEGEENGYNVCDYHEWRRDDSIELMDQMPVLYLTKELYTYIENDLYELPKKLLRTIHKRTILRKRQEKKHIDYAAIITDGKGILAFDTAGYDIPIRKSRLIPKQEQHVFTRIKQMHPQTFEFHTSAYTKEYHLLSLHPMYMYGLTRKERAYKQILMMALDQLKTSSTLEELRYWLTEWNPKKYPRIKEMETIQVWNALYNGLIQGWSAHHEEFGKKVVQSNPFLLHMWEAEQLAGHKKPTLK